MGNGVWQVMSALDKTFAETLLTQVDGVYETWEPLLRGTISSGSQTPVPHAIQFLPQASSFALTSVFVESKCFALLQRLAGSPVNELLRQSLGDAVLCDLDQSWVRRQFAPHRYPPHHAPHGWHQDGALGFDFLGQSSELAGPGALLPIVTCWVALTPCGRRAPGLELVRERMDELVAFAELTDANIRERFSEESLWQPELEAGDALVFASDILHRTHVHESMVDDRTSLELRFVAEGRVPERLATDRFARVNSKPEWR